MRVLGVELFLSKSFYGKRPLVHVAVVNMGPQWHRLELASWALEASWEPGKIKPCRADYYRAATAMLFAVCTIVDWGILE